MGRIISVVAVIAIGLVLAQPQPISYAGVQTMAAPPQLCEDGVCAVRQVVAAVVRPSSLVMQSEPVAACGGKQSVYRKAPVRSWAANRRTPIRSVLQRSRSRRVGCGG